MGWLPSVFYFFGKAEEVVQMDGGAVVQDHGAVKVAEDLVLVAFYEEDVGAGGTVDDGGEVHFETSVGGGKGPWGEEVVFAVGGFGDVEGDFFEFVGDAVVEYHIFTGGGGIAKAVADVEADGVAVDDALACAPVPGVVIGPHAATPVQKGEGVVRGEGVGVICEGCMSFGAHGDDFLVVVECGGFFGEGGGDNHGVTGFFG